MKRENKKSYITLQTSQNKGITLIALIITIIVLLILAVVAIRAVQGDGIISHAKNAQTRYEQEQAKELGILSSYEIELAKNSPVSLSDEMTSTKFAKTTFVKDSKGKIFVVPAGYTIVKDETTENTVEVDKGVVIKDDSNNQFVWVPTTTDIVAYGLNTSDCREPDVVTGATPSATVNSASGEEYDAVTDNLKRAGCTQNLNNDSAVNAYDFKIQLTNEFNEMAESVNKYDGFYVGRYEMSYSGTAKSVKGAPSAINTSSENDWYGLYAKAKTYTNSANSVVSRMIYGSQYNAMMTWMGEAANTNCDNRNKERTTGTCETDKIKNVYDLYGNSYEWTQEASNTVYRVGRGGIYYDSYSPSSSYSNNPTDTYSNGSSGSRLTLYIK